MSQHPLLFIITQPSTLPCKGSGYGSSNTPTRNQTTHANKLKTDFNNAWASNTTQAQQTSVVSLPVKQGMYLEVRGALGHDLATEKLGNQSDGCKLLNVRNETHKKKEVTIATLYVPDAGRTKFLERINQYETKLTKHNKPVNNELMTSIEDMSLAIMDSFWTDNKADMPISQPEWCEVWLIDDPEKTAFARFAEQAQALNIEYSPEASLSFPERTVALAKINKDSFHTLLHHSPDIAECRLFREPAEFFIDLPRYEQQQWIEHFLQNASFNPDAKVSICILDTGVNNAHPLLSPVLHDVDMHTAFEDEGTADNDGHGTNMAGVATYGNLANALASPQTFNVQHCLESCKIIPKAKNLPAPLYGFVTVDAVTQASLAAPPRTRQVCMAISAPSPFAENGEPTSWSAAVDALAAGVDSDKKYLVLIGAGNVREPNEWKDYHDINMLRPIEDPAQSWNALTIGAYTNFEGDNNITALVPQGGLSPFSRTSTLWHKKWPSKPDVVFEGGNITDAYDPHELLSVLTTSANIQSNYFTYFTATSAATAEAAWFAAQVQVAYPNAWPETIRALIVHSARWTQTMLEQFAPNEKKSELTALKGICGYGVPNLERALQCKKNSLTLVVEQELQPYIKGNKDTKKGMQMHLYDLPWPKDALQDLGEANVTMRITLSYFIEPGPGQRGWKDKYRYASHGLRFDVKGANESVNAFENRISQTIKDDEDDIQTSKQDTSSRWIIGKNSQSSGSIHSDFWTGTAAELATCNQVAVFPVVGWWRERTSLKRVESKARYSLIVSLHTDAQDVDIYTPVKIAVDTPVIVSVIS